MPFASGPVLSYVGNGRYVTVGQTDYVGATGEVVHVPSDFGTDLATIPRVAWAILPPNGVWEKAAVVHDWGCVCLANGTCTMSSRDVDGLFRRIVRESQEARRPRGSVQRLIDLLVRWTLWAGVRWGALFNRDRRPGWLAPRSSLPTLGITAVLLALVCAVVYGVDRTVHWIF